MSYPEDRLLELARETKRTHGRDPVSAILLANLVIVMHEERQIACDILNTDSFSADNVMIEVMS